MKPVRFLQYKASRGCKKLTEKLMERGLDALRLKVNGSTYRGNPEHIIINWGSTCRRSISSSAILVNDPSAVDNASNKIKTLRLLEVGLGPDWTTDRGVAEEWIEDGKKVYCRTLIRAREGRGIVVARTKSEIVDAPLYTIGLDISREMRVHVFDEQVIDYVQKKKMSPERLREEGIEVNYDVRNHGKGWVFAREDTYLPDNARDAAISAVRALGLVFGAVDIIITTSGQAKVLEVNTAPGLEGTTLDKYTEAIVRYASSL